MEVTTLLDSKRKAVTWIASKKAFTKIQHFSLIRKKKL